MCNIRCKYEGFQGKCIKQLYGIPKNIKPKECNKKNKNKLILLQNYTENIEKNLCSSCSELHKFPLESKYICGITNIFVLPTGTCNFYKDY